MRKISILLALMLMIAFPVGMVHAAVITLNFVGEITEVIDDQNKLGGAISVGDSFSTIFAFDDTALDSIPGDTSEAWYGFTAPSTGLYTDINGNTFQTEPSAPYSGWYIFNGGSGEYDVYVIQSYENVTSFPSLNIATAYTLRFYDSTGTAFANDYLPNSIDIDSYETKLLAIGNPAGPFYIEGTINAVPVPAAVWLLGSGLIGLVGLKRKFGKT